jgi:flagellar basal-body rod modification protein FlgD
MTVETTSYYESLLTASSETADTSTASTSLGSMDFLNLLITQLQYQDPTEPVDNTEMVNQMTQFSQLESLTSIDEKLDELTSSLSAATTTSAINYLGKEVEASGYSLSKSGDDISDLYLTLDDDAESVTINIYNSSGTIVDTETLSALEAGSYSFTWDGLDSDGSEADDGTYYADVSAEDSNGDSVDVSTSTTGTVAGVSTTSDGVVLILDDGRTVNLSDVTLVTT